MSFMVGSFAAGLSEGLDSGWKLGKDIQAYSREEEIRSATKKAQEDAKAKAALPSVAAKAPSVNDPDTSGPAGLSAGQTNLTETGWDDPTAHPDATTPPTLDKDGNAVPKTAAKPAALLPPWQSRITQVPDDDKSGAAPSAGGFPPEVLSRPPMPATPPPVVQSGAPAGDFIWTEDEGLHRARGGENAPSINQALTPGTRYTGRPQAQPSPFGNPRALGQLPRLLPPGGALPSAPAVIGGALPPAQPQAYTNPRALGQLPSLTSRPALPPSSPTPSVPIDPLTGQPYQQAVPY